MLQELGHACVHIKRNSFFTIENNSHYLGLGIFSTEHDSNSVCLLKFVIDLSLIIKALL